MTSKGVVPTLAERPRRQPVSALEAPLIAEDAIGVGSYERRFQSVFEAAAVAIWIEDFSDVLTFLDDLRSAGVKDLRDHLGRHPAKLEEAIKLIRVKDVNPCAVEMFEAPGRGVLKESLGSIFLPETVSVLEDELVTLWEGRRRLQCEAAVSTLRGRRFDAVVTIAFDGDRCQNTLVTLLDISAQKRATEQLELHARRLEALIRSTKAISGETDLERMVQTVTDAATDLVGAKFGAFFYNAIDNGGEKYLLYTLSGAPREDFEKFGMPRNTQLFDATFRGLGVIRSDDIREDARYGKNPPHNGMPAGHLPVVSYLAVPVVSRTGEVHGGLFFGHDQPASFSPESQRLVETIAAHAAIAIDNARLIQNALAEIERRRAAERAARRLAAVVESSEDAILAKDLSGIITDWNKGAERLLGYHADEVIGRRVTDLIPEDRHGEEHRVMSLIRSGELVAPFDTVRLHKDGSLVDVSAAVSPIRSSSGAVVGASTIARDIRDRHRAEERRRLLFREMKHRIRNLFAISGSLVGLSARSAKTLQELAADTRNRLNALAKAHALTLPDPYDEGSSGPAATNLRKLASTILSPFSMGIVTRVEIRGDDVPVAGEPATSLALVLHEFATNAAKYGALSAPTGRIVIDCRLDEDQLRLAWTERGGPRIDVGKLRQEGFGSFLGRATVESQLCGAITYDWQPEGLAIGLRLPLDRLSPPASS